MSPLDGPGGLTIVVGGVGELFQSDLDIGRLVVEELQTRSLPSYVFVEDFCYGALAVTARLEELGPDVLVLVGAKRRGRPAGTIERRVVGELDLDKETIQVAVGDAGTGYIDLDLTVEICWGFECLPARTILVEIEPGDVSPGEGLSEVCGAKFDALVETVEHEIELAPLFELLGQLVPVLETDRERLEGSIAYAALCTLVDELQRFDRDGRWGHAFSAKDRLRVAISEGETGEALTHADWGMWWALIEEVTRLERASALWA